MHRNSFLATNTVTEPSQKGKKLTASCQTLNSANWSREFAYPLTFEPLYLSVIVAHFTVYTHVNERTTVCPFTLNYTKHRSGPFILQFWNCVYDHFLFYYLWNNFFDLIMKVIW